MTIEKTKIEINRIFNRLRRKGYKGEWLKIFIADLIWYAGEKKTFRTYKEVLDFIYSIL